MAKRVTCNEAVGRHLELLKAEAHLELPPGGGGGPLDSCDWAVTGATKADAAHELRSHVSRAHGFDLDSLKPELRERVLSAIADA